MHSRWRRRRRRRRRWRRWRRSLADHDERRRGIRPLERHLDLRLDHRLLSPSFRYPHALADNEPNGIGTGLDALGDVVGLEQQGLGNHFAVSGCWLRASERGPYLGELRPRAHAGLVSRNLAIHIDRVATWGCDEGTGTHNNSSARNIELRRGGSSVVECRTECTATHAHATHAAEVGNVLKYDCDPSACAAVCGWCCTRGVIVVPARAAVSGWCCRSTARRSSRFHSSALDRTGPVQTGRWQGKRPTVSVSEE